MISNEGFTFLISKLAIELQQSRPCSTCVKTALQINGTEPRVQK